MRTTISIVTFLMISILSFGQERETFLKNWYTYPIPEKILGYTGSKNNWIVYLDKNEIRVIDDFSYKYKQNLSNKKLPFKIEQPGLIDVIQVNDGYLVGFNRGEWGGSLYWYSKNGKKSIKIGGSVFSTSPIQFIKRDNQIYAITGLSHLSILSPSSMVIQNDVVYVGMRGGVYKFDLTTKKEEWLLPPLPLPAGATL